MVYYDNPVYFVKSRNKLYISSCLSELECRAIHRILLKLATYPAELDELLFL